MSDGGIRRGQSLQPLDLDVWLATAADGDVIGLLLHDFNTEYGDDTPGPERLAARVRQLIAGGDTSVLLGGWREVGGSREVGGPREVGTAAPSPTEVSGLAVLRFRQSIWTEGLECHLAELYVRPARRGEGLGRALLQAAVDHARQRGADYMELGTEETDVAARALYESMGFTNRTPWPDGPFSYVYERDL